MECSTYEGGDETGDTVCKLNSVGFEESHTDCPLEVGSHVLAR